jgi:hypothetical protein
MELMHCTWNTYIRKTSFYTLNDGLKQRIATNDIGEMYDCSAHCAVKPYHCHQNVPSKPHCEPTTITTQPLYPCF